MDPFRDILTGFLDALALDAVVLAGVSMDGGVAIGFALQRPTRVSKLVLVDSYGLQDKAPAHVLSYLFLRMPLLNELTWALVRKSRSLTRSSLAGIFHNPARIPDELVETVYDEIRKPHTGRALRSFQVNEATWNGLRTIHMPRLAEIQAPTLIVHGEEEPSFRSASRARPRRAFPEAGHWPQREKPDQFNSLVSEFLST